jgi:hypothetical protein
MNTELEAINFNIDDKVDNYILCINDGIKMWKKTMDYNEELQEEPYILGNLNIKEKQNESIDKNLYYSHIPNNINKKTPVNKTISIYHQFIKDKIIEFSNTHPTLSKKDRYRLVLDEWKKVKSY